MPTKATQMPGAVPQPAERQVHIWTSSGVTRRRGLVSASSEGICENYDRSKVHLVDDRTHPLFWFVEGTILSFLPLPPFGSVGVKMPP